MATQTGRESRGSSLSAADQAYGAAAHFLSKLSDLASTARGYEARPILTWTDPGRLVAETFAIYFDLNHLISSEVRRQARRAYPIGAPSIVIGRSKKKATLLEAIVDELGGHFRWALYPGRPAPLTRRHDETPADAARRLGLNTISDVHRLLIDDWEARGRDRAEASLELLRCPHIDFDELLVQLDREAQAVLASEKPPSAPRGRRPKYDEDRLLSLERDWNNSDLPKPEFCKLKHILVKDLDRMMNALRSRRRRASAVRTK